MPGTSYDSITTSEPFRSSNDGGMSTPTTGLLSPKRRRRHSTKSAYFQGEATWASSVINLLNTIVGAGVLAMPRAMSQFGIVLGVFVIVFSAFASGFGLYLQARCSKYVERGTASFFSLSQLTYPNAAVIFDAAIAIKCFGVAVSYLIIIGELMPQVVRGFSEDLADIPYLSDRHFWITAFMLIVIPISFLRRLDSLKYTSIIALTSIAYLILLVFAHFMLGDATEERGPIRVITWSGPVDALKNFPIIVFAYTCHQNMFSIVNEIRDNSHSSTLSVIAGSIGTGCVTYVFVAITGYLSFGGTPLGNIIAQYSPSWTSTIGCAAIVVLVMFSYPLQVHPCRASVDNVLKWRPRRSNVPPPPRPPNSARAAEMSDTKFAIISTVIIIGTYATAMSVSSLTRVLSYVGSTGSTSISFILPGLFYWKISSPESDNRFLLKDHDDEWEGAEKEGGWKDKAVRKASLALAIYGVVVMVVCLGTNVFLSGEEAH